MYYVYLKHALHVKGAFSSVSLYHFLDNHKTLAADCCFKTATADEAGRLAIRDAFISGMLSSRVRLIIIEIIELSLVKQTRALELAQLHSK